MPPKARITKEMVIEAGFRVVQREGVENLNVRKIAAELSCSTQPVMYHYKTVEELRADIYRVADEFHSDYIMQPEEGTANPLLSIGLRYIRFAHEETHLFRFLFQTGQFRNIGFRELLEGEASAMLLGPLMQQTGLTEKQAVTVFEALFTCVHGFASMLANNSMEYDEVHCTDMLTTVFRGSVGYVMRGEEG